MLSRFAQTKANKPWARELATNELLAHQKSYYPPETPNSSPRRPVSFTKVIPIVWDWDQPIPWAWIGEPQLLSFVQLHSLKGSGKFYVQLHRALPVHDLFAILTKCLNSSPGLEKIEKVLEPNLDRLLDAIKFGSVQIRQKLSTRPGNAFLTQSLLKIRLTLILASSWVGKLGVPGLMEEQECKFLWYEPVEERVRLRFITAREGYMEKIMDWKAACEMLDQSERVPETTESDRRAAPGIVACEKDVGARGNWKLPSLSELNLPRPPV